MEKEQILSEIKTKLGQTGLSDRTLTDYVSANLPAEGTEPDTTYFDKHTSFLKSLSGNYSHDVAGKVDEFKKNYKPQQEPPKPVETLPSADSELLKRLEALETARQNEAENARKKAVLDGLRGKSDGLKVANKAIWNDVVSAISVTDEATADTLLTAAKSAYEAKLKEYMGDGALPYSGEVTPPKGDATQLDDFFKQKEAEGKMPKTE